MLHLNNKNVYWIKIPIIDNFLKKILNYNRQKIHKIFLNETSYTSENSLLDVGTSNTLDKNHNIILQKTINNRNIYSLSNTDLPRIKEKYKNISEFYKGDGRQTNLNSNYFDIVFSSATIEHVGSFENQLKFMKEAYRLSKKITFITTPNRYYPLDFHTKLPFIHWLPKKLHRKILKLFKLKFYAEESNLNLLSLKDLQKMIKILEIKNYKIIKHNFLFLNSNIIIVLKKYDK